MGDFVAVMDDLISQGKSFDVVSCLGVYYHTMHHYKMLMQMTQFKPKAIVIDSVFNVSDKPIIELWKEKTEGKLRVKFNTISQVVDQTWAPVGKISRPAMEMMAESLGYHVEWVKWDVPQGQRRPVIDYFKHRKHPSLQRFTCVLRQASLATRKTQIENTVIDDDDDDTDN